MRPEIMLQATVSLKALRCNAHVALIVYLPLVKLKNADSVRSP
jgi:hypothetical protein